jgi:outer membrane protein TolC
MNRIWSLGVQINIPIFDGFATIAAVQQTESVLKQVQLGGDQVKVGVEFEVRAAYLNLHGAQTLIDVQREAVAQARESVRIANLQFQNGIITTVALTDTQLALAQAEVNRLQSYHDYVVGLVRLEKAVGQTLQ